MSAHWGLTFVLRFALTHKALTPATVNQDIPWMLMGVLAMVQS